MTPTSIHLRSPFLPAECAARLVAAIDPETFVSRWGMNTASTKPVVGYVRGTSLRIRMRGPSYFRNTSRAYLNAELLPAGSGTALTGTVGMHPSARANEKTGFAALGVVGGIGVLWVALAYATGWADRRDDNVWTFLLIWALLLAFAVCLKVSGRRTVRSESRFLIDFVARTLDAGSPSLVPRP